VRRTAKHDKHPERGQLRLATGAIVHLNVSKDALYRACLLADRFIRTAEAIGWTLTEPPPPERPAAQPAHRTPLAVETAGEPVYAQLLVDGEPISFLIEERYREEVRVPRRRPT
jgi:hypothetical protein